MGTLSLEDLKGFDDSELRNHLISEYEASEAELNDLDILVAYESVGNWGCHSSSYFLFKKRSSGEMFEVRGSHCSCFGFEGQFDLEPVSVEYLKSDQFSLYCGGYDNNADKNLAEIKHYMQSL